MSRLTCRLCGESRLRCLGSIPDNDFFAGCVLERPISGGTLWLCNDCGSMLRHPVLSHEHYARLYETGAEDAWTADAARNDLAVIRSYIAQRGGGESVLDVGCNSGGLLLSLPDVRRYGVDPSNAAASKATQAGICILGKTLEDVADEALFDVITIIDVIEHLVDPISLLDSAAAHLAPGGGLVIATGDPCNFWWRRVFRSRFWYSGFPEHITFPSLRALDLWGQRRGLGPPNVKPIRYRSLAPPKQASYICQMITYTLSPELLNAVGRYIDRLRGLAPPRRRYFSPGGPGVFTDHQVVIFTRASKRR